MFKDRRINNIIKKVISNTSEAILKDKQNNIELQTKNIKMISSDVVSFIFNDGESINLTSDGYFDFSKNGSKHLKKIPSISKNSTLDQYYEKFYRPNIVKLALEGKKTVPVIQLSDVNTAPIVEIINTVKSTNKEEATITLKITKQSGGLGEIRIYLNGIAVSLDDQEGLRAKPNNPSNKDPLYKSYTIKLSKGKNQIRAIAFNAENTMQSKDAFYHINANFQEARKPSLYALVIGIDEYENPKLTLNYAVADAKLFKETIQSKSKGLFDKVNVTILSSKNETNKSRIISELNKMKQLNPDDVFVFYVASHGEVDNDKYYLYSSDVGSISTSKLIILLAKQIIKEDVQVNMENRFNKL